MMHCASMGKNNFQICTKKRNDSKIEKAMRWTWKCFLWNIFLSMDGEIVSTVFIQHVICIHTKEKTSLLLQNCTMQQPALFIFLYLARWYGKGWTKHTKQKRWVCIADDFKLISSEWLKTFKHLQQMRQIIFSLLPTIRTTNELSTTYALYSFFNLLLS